MGFEYDPDTERRPTSVNTSVLIFMFEAAAEALGDDAGLVEISCARTTDEPRWLLIGKIDAQHTIAIITRRGDNIS